MNDTVFPAFPLEPTPAAAQGAIADNSPFFGDWSERYQYLIDLGRKLPPPMDDWKTEQHRLHGCQSMVWIVPSGTIVNSISPPPAIRPSSPAWCSLALRVYSGAALATSSPPKPDYIAEIGLASTCRRPAATAWLRAAGLHPATHARP